MTLLSKDRSGDRHLFWSRTGENRSDFQVPVTFCLIPFSSEGQP